MKKLLFLNLDTQKAIMRKAPEETIDNLEELRECIRHYEARVLSTSNCYEKNSLPQILSEDSPTRECTEGSKASRFIPETNPGKAHSIYWYDKGIDKRKIRKNGRIILHKNHPNPFLGNPHTKSVLELMEPEKIIIYGANLEGYMSATIEKLREKHAVRLVYDAIFPKWNKNLPSDILLTTQQISEGNF